jgi:peptidyl-prolyl cis-trans isomerase B (cyclophilin B)
VSSKRQRELARRRAERQAERRAELARRRRKRQRTSWAVFGGVLTLLLAVFLVPRLFDGDDATDPQASASPSASGDPTPSPSAAPGECAYTPVAEQGSKDVGVPPADGFDKKPRTATIKLNTGTVEFETFSDKAPCTVGSLVHLAGKKYFDGTKCHRLTTGEGLKVLQCGDPTGTGAGGPGYQMAEENLDGATYKAGTVAMAKAQAPGSTGSQFFLVYADSTLPPEYTPLGKITKGLDVLQKIADAGTADGGTDGAPKSDVLIETLTVKATAS